MQAENNQLIKTCNLKNDWHGMYWVCVVLLHNNVFILQIIF